jgi:phenylacetate-CoA ligase
MTDEARYLYSSPSEIEALQLDRLRVTVERAKKAPAFADRLAGAKVASLADVAHLPLTTKKDLQDASPFGSVAVPNAELFQYHESFGTTGVPVSSWLTKNDFHAYADQINQCALDFNAEDLVVNKFPYSISVPAHIVKLAAQNRGACVVSAGSLTSVCPYTRALDLMKKLKATVLTCLPTEATLLSAAAQQMGMNPSEEFNLRAIGTAGEQLTQARKRRIEAIWNCKVYNYYGTTETGNMASDCSSGQLHLAWDHFLFEILDEQTQQPVPRGQPGMPVVTTLTREAMPLVRYAITDLVRLEYDHNCPCGRKSPIVHHYGRDVNRFKFQGRKVSMADLEERVFRLPPQVAGNIWMIVVTPDEVVFRIESTDQDSPLAREAEKEISKDFGFPFRIDAVPEGMLFPTWWLLEPARVGKPAYCCEAPSVDQAPQNLPELWGVMTS